MEKTDAGTTVGVDDPYDHVDRCDHLTDEGRCRFAVEQSDRDPEFANARSRDDFRCPVVCAARSAPGDRAGSARREAPRSRGGEAASRDATREVHLDEEGLTGPWDWADCPHFRCRNHDRECIRCGLEEHRMAHDDERPLLEEHHLSYSAQSSDGDDDPAHEITVYICRWCHAKVHNSWARIDDDVNPDPEAIAEREGRRSREQDEFGFQSAAERFDTDEDASE